MQSPNTLILRLRRERSSPAESGRAASILIRSGEHQNKFSIRRWHSDEYAVEAGMANAGMSRETAPFWPYVFITSVVVGLLIETIFKNNPWRKWLESRKITSLIYKYYLAQYISSLLATGLFAYTLLLSTKHELANLFTLSVAVFLFGASLFMILDEVMYRGLGRWLTKRLDGNNWVKRIDYVYLLMGSAGIAVSLDRLSAVPDKSEFLNDLGPLVLAAAIAVRLTKTRIEVNGWDKIKGEAPKDSKAPLPAAD